MKREGQKKDDQLKEEDGSISEVVKRQSDNNGNL